MIKKIPYKHPALLFVISPVVQCFQFIAIFALREIFQNCHCLVF